MRLRWTTLLAASVAAAACARPSGLPPPPREEPVLRIGLLTGAADVRIGAAGGAIAALDGTPVARVPAGTEAVLRVEGAAFRLDAAGGGRYERLAFASTAPERHVAVNGRTYRGAVEVFVRGGALTVVNVVGLERYLAGVVNAEMGRRGPEDRAALEAQAVVSRTYALVNRGRFGAEGFDLRAGVSDQVYGGVESETDAGLAAVRATVGLVLTVHGAPITPFYHSTCGGATASPEEAFVSVRGTPYLRSVSDARPGGGHYCDLSPRYRWTVEWEGDSLRAILRRTLPATLGIEGDVVRDLRDVYVRRRGPSGRATDVRVRVADGEIPVPAHAVRTVFETPEGRPLGSAAVVLEPRVVGDRLGALVARGQGWGHGVGMCQWGAVGRARTGQDVRTILETYFPGTTLARWY